MPINLAQVRYLRHCISGKDHTLHVENAVEWDGNCEPRLLMTHKREEANDVPTQSIQNYAWSDGKTKVSIYVDLQDIGKLSEDDILLEWTNESIELTVKNFHDANHCLKLSLYDKIQDAHYKKKEHKLIVLLKKENEISWHQLKKDV